MQCDWNIFSTRHAFKTCKYSKLYVSHLCVCFLWSIKNSNILVQHGGMCSSMRYTVKVSHCINVLAKASVKSRIAFPTQAEQRSSWTMTYQRSRSLGKATQLWTQSRQRNHAFSSHPSGSGCFLSLLKSDVRATVLFHHNTQCSVPLQPSFPHTLSYGIKTGLRVVSCRCGASEASANACLFGFPIYICATGIPQVLLASKCKTSYFS